MFGYMAIFTSLNVSCYYNTLLTYAYRYLFVSFQSPLPLKFDDSNYFNQ